MTGDDDFDPRKYPRYFGAPREERPIVERDVADVFLRAARFSVRRLVSPREDPPDCEAIIDGVRAGIEVTELVDREALRLRMKGTFAYVEWSQRAFLDAIQDRITEKDLKPFKGGPYARKMLVIYTDEFTLPRDQVKNWLVGQRFATSAFDHVVLGFSYHPHHRHLRPAFRLRLAKPSASAS